MSLPAVFVGSSSEGLLVAEAIGASLCSHAVVTMWRDVFTLGNSTLGSLVDASRSFDFAVLVLTSDDLTTSRGTRRRSPRDNVLFECGLFMGALGRHRTFVAFDNSLDVKIPSDLAGITLATFGGDSASASLAEIVELAVTKIGDAIARLGKRRPDPSLFWAPFLSTQPIGVVGKFTEFDAFEASGLVGLGDAACLIEVSANLRAQYGFELPLRYANHFDAHALSGNLILVGGPDANAVTGSILRRLNTGFRFGDSKKNEISFLSRVTGTSYVPETGSEPVDYGVLIRARNPFSPESTVLLMFGCFGFGTWAAGRCAISPLFLSTDIVARGLDLECVVRTEVVQGVPQPATICELRERTGS